MVPPRDGMFLSKESTYYGQHGMQVDLKNSLLGDEGLPRSTCCMTPLK